MNLKKRADVIRAMDLLVRSANNEEIFDYWVTMGVADEDTNTTNDEDLENYCDDEDFAELMGRFLYVMKIASYDGGLYVDNVSSKNMWGE